MFKNYNL